MPSALIVAVLTIACCGLLAVVMVLGDFCMEPAHNTLLFLPPDTRAQAVGEYYTTCNQSTSGSFSLTLAAAGAPSLTALGQGLGLGTGLGRQPFNTIQYNNHKTLTFCESNPNFIFDRPITLTYPYYRPILSTPSYIHPHLMYLHLQMQ